MHAQPLPALDPRLSLHLPQSPCTAPSKLGGLAAVPTDAAAFATLGDALAATLDHVAQPGSNRQERRAIGGRRKARAA